MERERERVVVKPTQVFIATRPWSFIMTVISVLLGLSYAIYVYGLLSPFNIGLTLLALAGAILLHAAVNVWNDYYDYMYGVDRAGAGTTVYRPHPLVEGYMTPRQLQVLASSSAILALAIGLVIALNNRLLALLLGAVGLAIAFWYTGPPFRLKYHGLGEALVAAVWGPLITGGAYYVATGELSIGVILASIPLGLLVAAVLLANNIRDLEVDAKMGIRTLAVRLGRRNAVKLYASLILSTYIIQALLTLIGIVPVTSLVTLATLPEATRLVRLFRREVPPDADPRTARLVQNYGLAYIVGILASKLFMLH